MRRRPSYWVVVVLGGVAVGGWWSATRSQNPPSPRSGPADVTAFGAAGDGRADDTAAVQRAVDSGSGSVRFAKGTYRLTRPVVIDLDRVGFTALAGDGTARVVMAGAGPALKFVGTHAGTAAPATVKANV